ncbi:hypothetical protein RirG_221540 [Rhizophagus irregularis DAOM 197198w]|uniref:Uncharacterized protein n=1 Tax=Rhizophagus irregularis (strain DAOM 197198w) TaxID=1432141 RepID=A0A015K8S0_RHIIW|nr:hypothetical protein RirG_221540 [Rhizophagus irregularis DAOM 197198w]
MESMSLGHRVAPHLFSEPSQRAEPHEIYTIDDGNFAIFCQEVQYVCIGKVICNAIINLMR